SNAWVGKPADPRSGRLTFHGLKVEEQDEAINIRLTRAVTFPNAAGEELSIPAKENVGPETKDLIQAWAPFGGTFVDLLVDYLTARDSLLPEVERVYNKDTAVARSALPPPLLREGEKTQPAWLYQFLRNPDRVRRLTVLQMPKFSLGESDTTTLVNFFAAVD